MNMHTLSVKINCFLYIIFVVCIFSVSPMSAYAASSFLLVPENATISNGQTVSVNIYVDPNDTKDYTAKVMLDYPADVLSITSFTFAQGWIPISVVGYDTSV